MADLIQTGQQWHDSKRHETRTLTVTLRRTGETDTTNVAATIGTPAVQSLDDGGNIVTDRPRDFVIRVSDYAFGGLPSPPAEQDKIIDSTTGTELFFMVMPVAGEPAARYTNYLNTLWRIHTIQVDS